MQQRHRERRSHGHLDVLATLPSDCRAAVVEQCKPRAVAKGGTLWTQGEAAAFAAVLVSGKVMSVYEARNGRSGTVGFWTSGDFLGLGDLVVDTRQHTVRCLEACHFLTLPFDTMDELVRRHPDFGIAMMRALSVRLRWVAQLALGLETGSALERIGTVLLALSERFGEPTDEGLRIGINLTHEQLAAIAGVTRQFTNTTLKQLRDRGVLAAGRAIVLTDVPALERMVFSP
jgi:CRP-like cAMP-binding protein